MVNKSKLSAVKRQATIKKRPLPVKPGDEIQSDPAPDSSATAPFPVVGIGASAGGLAAFEAFFSGMPADTDPNMAFVLVQHLAPDHKSLLSELVQRYTRMQVFEVEDGITVQPNCAYIIPPNRDLALTDGKLRLLEQTLPHGQRLPIDFFFRTLAEDRREKAICIILSGTGSDGTLGVRAVKALGGMVMAQIPESTAYDGMPRSAIATGMVDYVLAPPEMPAQLIAYVTHAFGRLSAGTSFTAPKTDDVLKNVFSVLRSQTGHDFSLYKEKTVNRRIERRMALHQIDRLDGYLLYLQQNPDEAEALFHDLLIGVTSFFRDSEVFAALAEQAIPALFINRPVGTLIRIWVPGCSTGEEAYSIAILLLEYMETHKERFRIQIFATDIDRRAIETARAGIYPSGLATDVSAQRLSQFFDRDEENEVFRIKKRVRDMMIFSEQDVIRDPPFSRLDLISCRNLLIYLGGELQKKLIPLFHYALNPGGTLLLGTSETVSTFSDLFSALDRKAKIYHRIDDVFGKLRKYAPTCHFTLPCDTAAPLSSLYPPGEKPVGLRELTEKTLLQHFAPAGALVNNQGDILYLYGRTGMYLEPSPGEAGMNILRMAREGLRQDLSAALRKAGMRKAPVFCPGIRVKTNGDFTMVDVTIRPVTTFAGTPQASALLLVIIEEVPEGLQKSLRTRHAPEVADKGRGAASGNNLRIAALQQELRVKEEYLQTTVEELNSSNEEMQSINEELQSSNEELETSKEELQSVNEELATVNFELQTKVTDLTRTNNDMNNLLAGTGIGTIFVDNQMRIRRFTPAVTKIINLIMSDIGRPVNHIVSNLAGYDRLTEDIQAVLDDLVPKDIGVQTRAGVPYMLRIQPYRTLENVIEGAVVTFIDNDRKITGRAENNADDK